MVYAVVFFALLGVAITAGVKMGFALRAGPEAPPSASVATPAAAPAPSASGSGVIEIPMIDLQEQPQENK
jgi:hypothetical protein